MAPGITLSIGLTSIIYFHRFHAVRYISDAMQVRFSFFDCEIISNLERKLALGIFQNGIFSRHLSLGTIKNRNSKTYLSLSTIQNINFSRYLSLGTIKISKFSQYLSLDTIKIRNAIDIYLSAQLKIDISADN